ncbi:hypothetical protein BaRGS_00017967 [Batillaria attramentaria]|uniref:Uncharacterized protein n=1 Tax=Batillaria attramentaria TaxID=370345 RepID=A0ABD0KUJ0_9CAEN
MKSKYANVLPSRATPNTGNGRWRIDFNAPKIFRRLNRRPPQRIRDQTADKGDRIEGKKVREPVCWKAGRNSRLSGGTVLSKFKFELCYRKAGEPFDATPFLARKGRAKKELQSV